MSVTRPCPLNLSPEEIAVHTSDWTGERFPDGRPKVSDDILARMRSVTVTEAWGVLRNAEYHWQYEGNWFCTRPGEVLVGRALTAMYMPRRPAMRTVMEKLGAEVGCVGDQISWPIDMLVPGDVYVADVFGKIEDGPIVGENLCTAIYANSGNGVVHDAALRDLDGVRAIEGFAGFFEEFIPPTRLPKPSCWSGSTARFAWVGPP